MGCPAVPLRAWAARISGSLGAALSRPVTPITYGASDRGMDTGRLLACSWYGPAFTLADDW